ncbi:beta-lactamase class C and other penicillin binding protein [Amniculicola lignicola CBS 123094]|uniref:Beta-lactamase class C and other penicillin binding protein n=1 Tax=Amniculicola lignicola CBS 123094 TaxID=1392246 RepID=A0A6A5X1K2_9PLEO|nr:beta-lactamase class C and other penicillin binding protein [Amniculicola lignicola CBS 123094]
MDKFNARLSEATVPGSDTVHAVITAVVDKDGNYIHKSHHGHNGTSPTASSTTFSQTLTLASCTKLITSITALQIVERGLITLDEPLDKHLPELSSQPIITPKGDDAFNLTPSTKSITLRHLLTHTSGAAYEFMSPTLLPLWRQSRGEPPTPLSTDGIVTTSYAMPRLFEAGCGWMYGPGLDWAGLLVARLTGQTFESYIEENISQPLGITTFTYHLSLKPEVGENLVQMVTRQEDGRLEESQTPFFPEPESEAGGANMYGNVPDYTRVLADLLKDSPVLLKKETADLLFTPQFEEGSLPLKDLYENHATSYRPMVGGEPKGVVRNHGLGGLVVMEDIVREAYYKPKGTLTWSGMPNLLWSINREKGLALIFATQVLPFEDVKVKELWWAFENAVWSRLAK